MVARLSRAQRRALELRAKEIRVRGQLESWPPDRISTEIVTCVPELLPLEAHRFAFGWSREELSRAIDLQYERDGLRAPRIQSSEICGWEHGRHVPHLERQEYLCRVYRTRPDKLGFGRDHSPRAWSEVISKVAPAGIGSREEPGGRSPEVEEKGEANRREFERCVGLCGVAALFDWQRLEALLDRMLPAEEPVLDEQELITAAFGNQAKTTSPAALLPSVVSHMEHLRRLRCPPALEARLWSLRGRAAVLGAWLAYLLDNRGDARRLYDLAQASARAAGDGSLAAHVLTGRSLLHSAVSRGSYSDPNPMALAMLTRAATQAGPAAPLTLRSWIAERLSEEHAIAGDAGAAALALERADTVISEAVGAEHELEQAWLAVYRGTAALALGQPEAATRLLHTALDALPPGHASERCATLVDLAAAHADLREVDQACARLGEARDLATRYRLGNRLQRILGVRRERLGAWAAEPAVRQLDERLTDGAQ